MFQSESPIYSCLNVKELFARSRRHLWRLSDCNETRSHNYFVPKRTLNNLAKLAKLLRCVVSTYLYGAFVCMFLSCQVCVSEWIHQCNYSNRSSWLKCFYFFDSMYILLAIHVVYVNFYESSWVLFQTDNMETRSLVASVGFQIVLFEAVLECVFCFNVFVASRCFCLYLLLKVLRMCFCMFFVQDKNP